MFRQLADELPEDVALVDPHHPKAPDLTFKCAACFCSRAQLSLHLACARCVGLHCSGKDGTL